MMNKQSEDRGRADSNVRITWGPKGSERARRRRRRLGWRRSNQKWKRHEWPTTTVAAPPREERKEGRADDHF